MSEKRKRPETLTAGCLFSGIGGFCAGLHEAGIKVLWANEADKYASDTYRANYPKNRLLEKDVRELSVAGDKLPPVDILTAGFPCQSFSQAGDRKGFDDERGKLFFEIIRIIQEFGDNKPRMLLLENVPYLQHGKGGEWFETILCNIQLSGYWFGRHNCEALNTKEITDIPQRRERLFMVAMSTSAFPCNNFCFPAPNGKPLSLKKLINKTRKASQDHYMEKDNRYTKIIDEALDKSPDSICQLRRSYARINEGECPPLTANMGEGGWNVPYVRDKWGTRALTVEECSSLQGFKSDYFPEDVPKKERYKQLGNAVSVPVATKLAKECVRAFRENI